MPNSQPSPQTPLASPYGPSPQDFADALLQLHKTAPAQIRTPTALGTNLLADALLQYGQERARQQAQTGDPGVGASAPTVGPFQSLLPQNFGVFGSHPWDMAGGVSPASSNDRQQDSQ